MTISLGVFIYCIGKANGSVTIPGALVLFCFAFDAMLIAYLATKTN